MPAGQRKIMAMKQFGTTLLSLALFSSSCAGAENTTTPRPSSGSTTSESSTKILTPPPVDGIMVNATIHPANATSQSLSNSTTGADVAKSTTWSSVVSAPNSTLVDTPGIHNGTTVSSIIQNYTTEFSQEKANETVSINNTANTVQETKCDALHTGICEKQGKVESSYSGIILPVIIALIVISLVVFLLIAFYKICLKTTPERQENGTDQAPLDKENVKLISVKTTSPETGEQSSQGKNKNRQHIDSSSHLGNKRV